MVAVEEGSAKDLESLVEIDRGGLGSDERRRFLEEALGRGECFIANIDGRPVGFAVLDRSFFRQPYMSLLIVHPAHRRQRIGRALVHHLEAVCPSDKLFTSTNASNVVMQRFCKALGFVRSGIVENLDEDDPELIYLKRLQRAAKR